jgi:AcrR family transcriptional regulator
VREKQREETRRKLYLAALEVYRRDGMQACRVEDIAQRAEVSRAAFYFHFPTREHVMLELIHERDTPLLHYLAEAPADLPVVELANQFAGLLAANWREDARLVPDMGAVALCHTGHLANDRESTEVRAALGERFKAAAKRGELSAALPPESLADVFLANMLSTLLAWANHPDMELEFMLKGSVHLFFNGARGA